VLGVTPNAPEPDENPSGMRGKEDKATKSTDINQNKPKRELNPVGSVT